jgi:hypothetical protein
MSFESRLKSSIRSAMPSAVEMLLKMNLPVKHADTGLRGQAPAFESVEWNEAEHTLTLKKLVSNEQVFPDSSLAAQPKQSQ